jgi:hypothetical protein
MTLGGILNSFRKGAVHQKNQVMFRTLEFNGIPQTSGRGNRDGN